MKRNILIILVFFIFCMSIYAQTDPVIDMVFVEGNDNVSSFYISRFEVTYKQVEFVYNYGIEFGILEADLDEVLYTEDYTMDLFELGGDIVYDRGYIKTIPGKSVHQYYLAWCSFVLQSSQHDGGT